MSSNAENIFVKEAISNLQDYVDSLPEKGSQLTLMQKTMAKNLISWLHEHQSVDFAEVQKPKLGHYIYAYQFYKRSIQKEGTDDFSKLLAHLYTDAYKLSEEEPAFKEVGRKMK